MTLTLGRFVLTVSALVFIVYGLFCLFSPTTPAGFAGFELSNGDAYAEFGAMYGGLQTGVGLYCVLALLRVEFYRPALVLLVLGIGTLALARLIAALLAPEAVGTYTWGAFLYEVITVALAALALKSR